MKPPQTFTVPVEGGELTAVRWGEGPRVILGIHGITASSRLFLAIAERLGPDVSLVAPDLRGRGESSALKGPYGMAAHAQDCAAVLDSFGGEPTPILGVSMGAYVGVILAAKRPDLVERLVLVDGGLPLPLPEGADPEQLAEALLGPSLERFKMTFPSFEKYLDFWREHPAVSETWNEHVEGYLAYDLTGSDPELRSRVSEEAVRADMVDSLGKPKQIDDALDALTCPVFLFRAERGLLNGPPVLPEELVAPWRQRIPQLEDELIEDTNHYSIVLGDRGAQAIVDRVQETVEVGR